MSTALSAVSSSPLIGLVYSGVPSAAFFASERREGGVSSAGPCPSGMPIMPSVIAPTPPVGTPAGRPR